MNEFEKLGALKAMTGETDDKALHAYLFIAGAKICSRMAAPGETVTAVPPKYAHLQLEIAAYLINKRGAEGEISHSENGVSRSYESGDVPESMLRDVIPRCAVI